MVFITTKRDAELFDFIATCTEVKNSLCRWHLTIKHGNVRIGRLSTYNYRTSTCHYAAAGCQKYIAVEFKLVVFTHISQIF